ncbi:MAG: hypothetical protein ABTQ73_07505 [Caldilineales bacterium]
MNTLTAKLYEKKLLEEKAWCTDMIEHLADHATMDPQNNYAVTMARHKLVKIERALRRVAAGTYDQCDQCGDKIEAERLEILLDSEHHSCARCATAIRPTNKRMPVRQPAYGYGQMALAQA